MKPVTQSITMPSPLPDGLTAHQLVDAGVVAPGDCMRAAVASVCEFDLDQVPHFAAYRRCDETDKLLWWYALVGWFHTNGIEATFANEPPRGWSLVEGVSPRGIDHLVVALDGEIVHDPHPAGGGLTEITGYYQLTPRTPWAQRVLDRKREVVSA